MRLTLLLAFLLAAPAVSHAETLEVHDAARQATEMVMGYGVAIASADFCANVVSAPSPHGGSWIGAESAADFRVLGGAYEGNFRAIGSALARLNSKVDASAFDGMLKSSADNARVLVAGFAKQKTPSEVCDMLKKLVASLRQPSALPRMVTVGR